MREISSHMQLKIIRSVAAMLFLAISGLLLSCISIAHLESEANQSRDSSVQDFEYISPLPGARLVSTGTTIAIRQGEAIQADSVSQNLFTVIGSSSGAHQGETLLADDQKTVIFKPAKPFANEENVSVSVSEGLMTDAGEVLTGTVFRFVTAPQKPLYPEPQPPNQDNEVKAPAPHNLGYVTLPEDIPAITVTLAAIDKVATGYIFLSNINRRSSVTTTPYLLIVDNRGEP
ncbi:MAG: Ig-like domain-containing protein, partial [Anaerolineae bacterium]|nr:Ig-like domain-containing protein [Anaerolineae bacterium]